MRARNIPALVALIVGQLLLLATNAASQTSRLNADSRACKFQTSEFLRTAGTTREAIALQNKFVDPQIGVTQRLLLAVAQKSADSTTPPPKDEKVGHDEYGEPEKSWAERAGVAPYSLTRFLDILAEIVPGKNREAREESLQTLIEEQQFRDAPFTQKSARCFQLAVAKVLPTLPVQRQLYALGSEYYADFKSAELNEYLPALYDTIEKQLERSEDEAEREAGFRVGPREFDFYRTRLVKLVFEQNPGLGRDLILKEIFSPRPRISSEAFRLLPAEAIPGIDGVLASQIDEVYDNGNWYEFLSKLQVAEQFATADLFSKMKEIYERGKDDWSYDQEALFFSYFLRVAPEYARSAIEYRIAHPSQGSFALFTEVAGVQNTPDLYAVAEAYLADKNIEVANNAAYFFKYAKDRSVEPKLWRLLERWHAEWEKKADEIPSKQQSYQDSLVEALLFAGSKCPRKETVERLKKLYIKGKSSDGNIEFREWQNPVRFAISGYSKATATFQVQNCDGRMTLQGFKDEMQRFPAGTELVWTERSTKAMREALEPIYEELAEAARASGLTIRRMRPTGVFLQAP